VSKHSAGPRAAIEIACLIEHNASGGSATVNAARELVQQGTGVRQIAGFGVQWVWNQAKGEKDRQE
jgi:hypothetical protein